MIENVDRPDEILSGIEECVGGGDSWPIAGVMTTRSGPRPACEAACVVDTSVFAALKRLVAFGTVVHSTRPNGNDARD